MSTQQHAFFGKWITSEDMADLPVIDVFHRQLDGKIISKSKFQNKHTLFRRTFYVENTTAAKIFISADDYYKLYLNGQFVTQGPCPGYPFHYYYNEIDISTYLQKGENTLAVHTFYQGLINRVWVSGDNRSGLILDIVSGGETILSSDERFLVSEHTSFSVIGDVCGINTQYCERYDANAPETGFYKPDFDDSGWGSAALRANPDYKLFPQPTKQLVFEDISPAVLKKNKTGYFIDFGAMFVGYLAFSACGPCGNVITIKSGQELCDDDITVKFSLRANCVYKDEMVLSGARDAYSQFDYKAFRYVQLDLPEGCALDENSVKLIARHYPFKETARCISSDPVIKKVWSLCSRSLAYGVQEGIYDCMEREKGQYVGDGCFTSLSYALLTGDLSIMEKLIDDSLRTQFVNKGLMTCTTCSFMQEIAEYPLMLVMLCLAHYNIKKDRAFIAQRYDALLDILTFYKNAYQKEDGLLYDLDKWCVVEWPAKWRDGYDVDLTEGQICKGAHNVINGYFIGAAKALNKLAHIAGKTPVFDTASLKSAYINAFYDPAQGFFCDSTESRHISFPSNATALAFGLCPDEACEKRIIEIMDKRRLSSCMLFMTFMAFCGLVRCGRRDLVNEMIKDEGGWLRMIKEGATATFEGWGKNEKHNISLFHLCLTYPIVFLTDWDMEQIFK